MKDFWQKQIKEKQKLCFLAPMDWYGDSAYRQTMKKIAPDIICVSEFYSADWLVYSKTLADSVIPHDKSENPLIIQIFWKNPENFAKAAKIIEKYDIAWIDVNMWCPAKKVVKSWHGSGLMINEDTAYRIIEELNKATKLPISVKTRLWFENDDNLINFAKWLENAWATLITVHGRTAKQAYSWVASFDPIYELKKHIKIPIICNWDIKNYTDWINKVKNLDWFMIGRASFWNPWCFLDKSQINKLTNYKLDERVKGKRENWKLKAENKELIIEYYPTLNEILEIMFFHATKLVETKSERKWCLEIRKHLVMYLKNFPWVKSYRKKLVTVENLKDVENVINEIKNEYKDFLWKIPSEIEI